jgi:hypothetical protein
MSKYPETDPGAIDAGHESQIDPGYYILKQGGKECGQLNVISGGAGVTTEHWLLYKNQPAGGPKASYIFPSANHPEVGIGFFRQGPPINLGDFLNDPTARRYIIATCQEQP